jgi:hypothetical protein
MLRVLLVSALCALTASGEALAHGDPSTHYLETGNLYPSFAARPSQARELALMGLLQAAAERGYPIKVSLVASADDLVDAPEMLAAPQRYAESIQSVLGARGLRAPVVVVGPNGLGVAGMQLRGGELRRVSRSDARSFVSGVAAPEPEGDAMAATAARVVRRLARAAGRTLPAHVAPLAVPVPAVRSASKPVAAGPAAGAGGWAPFAALALGLMLAAVVQRVRRRHRAR